MSNRRPRRTAAQRAQSRFIALRVQKTDELMTFLMSRMGLSRNAAKSLLVHRLVYVNNKIETLYNTQLTPGMEIKISRDKNRKEFRSELVEILYEDRYLIVANKRHGLLSISGEKKKERSAHSILTDYVKRSNRQQRLSLVNKLDKDSSGLVIFAKDEKTKTTLQDNWNRIVADYRYIGVVCGVPKTPQGCVVSCLRDGEIQVRFSMPDRYEPEMSVTHYRTLKSNPEYSLLELKPDHERNNHVRIHMQDLGTPLSGDLKYGEEENPPKRLFLHAFRLEFSHPVTREPMKFETPVPLSFQKFFEK